MRLRRVGGRAVPALVMAGVDETTMASTLVPMAWDLPAAVMVQHTLDVAEQSLTRRVSDASGLLEQEVIHLDHACGSCALREDVVPTMERLAATGRWEYLLVQLPVAIEPLQVCRAMELDPTVAPHVRIAAVLAAVDGGRAIDDLLGDDTLAERGLETGPEDERGVAETLATIIEFSDVLITPDADPVAADLIDVLRRPSSRRIEDGCLLDTATLAGQWHDHLATGLWTAPEREADLNQPATGEVWTLDLRSAHGFHPERLGDHFEILSNGPLRTRGCFHLPTRPFDIGIWDGAGGQLSIGTGARWGRLMPFTRLTVVGLRDDVARKGEITAAFHQTLLRPDERRLDWLVDHDGYEPWLGPIDRVA